MKEQGDDTKKFLVDNRDDAIRHAKELAKGHPRGQEIVHNQDGQICEEFTYGEDPASSPG